jgi:hypothetical protein
MKKALIVGIDAYPTCPLVGCVNDAVAMATILERNSDGSPNFGVKLMTSSTEDVSAASVGAAIADLFTGDFETALFFFAGHGIINPETNAGYIVSQDGRRGSWGIALSELLGLANRASPRIKSTVIILDCCQSGYLGEVAGLANDALSVIGNGVTILTACHREGAAAEANAHGVFSSLLLDGLNGSAADIRGNVTPAALYTLIDQTLGPWEQRPIYKANVQTFVTLRQMPPKIPPEVLRKLPTYFPDATSIFPLDPSFEPDRENVPEALRHCPVDPTKSAIFKELQQCNRHGLIVPVDAPHMYYAAIESKSCRLTALGTYYRKLAEAGRV